ncbi:SusC/RagA family TonB-linked outer membrane protein [Odoribacteraceae bacterium]|nr:SusC/RagA family TonB-linked outer membrane protein [Odoribacteraceae bacterium]GKH93274.1 SusC/RagA family TonB-linked outer membrane protein [Odoribacteraceae bacterium]GKH99834.1 SusC/RagA family TonB-linked outer membrane protein [Odoribacteraceae bacterium]GKI04355.1 SusC/RagA family TonB-linked outer membrane protein [Odoribacteraceae bacterium]
MIMKWCIAFICLFTLNLSANVYSQKNIVSLDLSDVSVEQFVKAVKQQTSLKFMYNSSLIRQAGKISVKVENKELKDVLSMVLGKVNLEYEFFNNVILIRQKGEGKSEQQKKKVVNGTVKDEHGVTLPGVSVLIKGESVGVATDINGKYSITIPENKKEVVFAFSFVGMVPVEVRYTGQDSINVVLKEDVEKIDEVVVNGYFTRKKESYTGVSTTFSGNDLRKVSTGNILNTLSMLDPSFTKVVNNEMGSDPNTIPNFEIRGSSSLKADFDGNPNMPTFIMDGFEVSAEKVFDLDPTRVRFITILKDAAATAIYGSRAANGVVVIETEAPKPGKLQLSYNGSMNFEVADLSDYNLMNAEEKLEYEVRAGLYDKEDRPDWTDNTFDAYNQKLKLVKQGNDVDWLAIPVRELGVGHKHSIIAEGGNESFRYALDLSYSNKIGVMKGSKRDTYGGGIRLQYNLKKLKFTDYASFDHVKSVNSPYGNFSAYQYYNPYYNPYDENGNVKKMLYEYSYYDRGFQTKKMYNELYNAVLPSKDQSTSNRFLNNFAIEYDIIQGLKLKANLSLSVDNGRTDVYKPYENTEFIDKEKKGSYSQGQYEDFSYDVNIILTYFKTFKKHVLNAGFIYNLRETNHDQTDVYALGFPNANMDHISMGAGFKEGDKPGGAYDVTRLVGFVGNLGYTYDERFLLDFSVRSDGSSLYGSNNRWGTFWSLGLGYNLHHEKFMERLTFINLLKIRGSIGTTGGQNFNPYQSMAMYSYNDDRIGSISYSGYIGAILKAFGNKNLRWQKVEKQNVGLDFELFDRRLTGSFNVYNDISKDVLIDVTLAPSLGFSSYKENLGEVKNSGVELTLKGTVIRDREREIYWDIMYNLAHNKNKVTKINQALTAFNDKQDAEVKNKPVIRYKEGLSQNTIWANESLGIDPATGEEIFLDMNGNKVNEWDAANYKPFGSTDPKIYGTIGTMFTYKKWELNAHLYYKYGGYIYNSTLVDKVENVNPNENGDKRILYDRWNKEGDVAKFKKVSDVSVTNPTSRFIEKENYIQLQSLSIGYDFSCDKLREIGIQRLKLSAIGNDIFTSSTVKMERGTSYPFARTFSLSAQLTF